MGRRWQYMAFWLALIPSTMAENISEAIMGEISLDQLENPALHIRADAQATPLPVGGVAAVMGPNETHTYSWNKSMVNPNYSLSLSECIRRPLTEDALALTSGKFKGSTVDGGLLEIHNLSLLNDSIIVSSPITKDANAQWNYQLGYDTAATYFSGEDGLYWVDSDFANSLFVTEVYENFTKYLVNTPHANFVNYSNFNATTRNFNLFLHETNMTASNGSGAVMNSSSTSENDHTIQGSPYNALRKSYCAMQQTALLNQNNADFSTTDRSNNQSQKLIRGQFLFTGLNKSTFYEMQLGIAPKPGFVGGMLFPPVPFHTKQSTSCQLIYNMTNCPQTAFSVPGNASAYTVPELTRLYDEYVGYYNSNFTQAIDQLNCDGKRENRFSVFSSCHDCKTAYLDWLCTVAVPRCDDWSNSASYLKERLPGESRNKMINELLRPGKYKEVLPCYWLCENLATYCPLSMGFGCPTGNMMNDSYGWMSDNGDVTCSYPGAVYKPDAAILEKPSWLLLFTALAICISVV